MLVPIRNNLAHRFRCIESDFFVHFIRLLNKSAAEPPAGSFMNLLCGSIHFCKNIWEQKKSFLRLKLRIL
jgi:hypothetical protein